MNKEAVKEAMTLAQKVGYVFVATANESGLSHLAAATKITLVSNTESVSVEGWYCPTTLPSWKNCLKNNPIISLSPGRLCHNG